MMEWERNSSNTMAQDSASVAEPWLAAYGFAGPPRGPRPWRLAELEEALGCVHAVEQAQLIAEGVELVLARELRGDLLPAEASGRCEVHGFRSRTIEEIALAEIDGFPVAPELRVLLAPGDAALPCARLARAALALDDHSEARLTLARALVHDRQYEGALAVLQDLDSSETLVIRAEGSFDTGVALCRAAAFEGCGRPGRALRELVEIAEPSFWSAGLQLALTLALGRETDLRRAVARLAEADHLARPGELGALERRIGRLAPRWRPRAGAGSRVVILGASKAAQSVRDAVLAALWGA